MFGTRNSWLFHFLWHGLTVTQCGSMSSLVLKKQQKILPLQQRKVVWLIWTPHIFSKNWAMENIMCRFPHIFQQILEELDVSSFADCRLVGKSWLSFIANEKSTWIRVIKTLIEDPKEDKKLEKALKQCVLIPGSFPFDLSPVSSGPLAHYK